MLFRRYTKAYFSCLFLSTDKYCILNYVYNAAVKLKYKNKIYLCPSSFSSTGYTTNRWMVANGNGNLRLIFQQY